MMWRRSTAHTRRTAPAASATQATRTVSRPWLLSRKPGPTAAQVHVLHHRHQENDADDVEHSGGSLSVAHAGDPHLPVVPVPERGLEPLHDQKRACEHLELRRDGPVQEVEVHRRAGEERDAVDGESDDEGRDDRALDDDRERLQPLEATEALAVAGPGDEAQQGRGERAHQRRIFESASQARRKLQSSDR